MSDPHPDRAAPIHPSERAAAPPTAELRFRWSWRPYQARVLGTAEHHLRDDRLHIVAAPGAGKTTLGLEVFRRLGRPALVLVPTLTIREQWLRRLRDFAPASKGGGARPPRSWTSTDLRAPAFLTVTTYQAVLAHGRPVRGERAGDRLSGATAPSAGEVRALVATLRRARVGTVILDEAHHLKRAWWRALERIVAALDGVTLVSLTGTPPYDATGLEWRRYVELCGPIDDEISAPELVKAGTLCPHQDFVFAVAPERAEAASTRAHDEAVALTTSELLDDARFQRDVDTHPWVAADAPDVQAVLDDPELAVALLVFLKATGAALPAGLLDVLGLAASDLPPLARRWWQVLLAAWVRGGDFDVDSGRREALVATLRERRLLWRSRLRIARSDAIERTLGASAAKIGACVRVHMAERAARGEALRQVVLTDHVRAEALDAATSAPDLGAVPVFDALRRERTAGDLDDASDVGLVTGTVALLHGSRLGALRDALRAGADVVGTELPGREGWLRLEGVKSGALVAAYTRLLGAGALRTLVGTRALLGEGWDAPSVNSLVIASRVGASVSTNQMRGRAIRVDPDTPGKVASVWHLVAVSPETRAGFLDCEGLAQRFRTFVGLGADGLEIVSGIERLALPPLRSAEDLDAFNRTSLYRLQRLETIGEDWRRAIDRSDVGHVVPTVSFRRPLTLRPLQLTRTLRYVLLEAGLASALTVGEVMRRLAVDAGGGGGAGLGLMAASVVPMALLAPKLLRAATLALRHAPVAGSVGQIGTALLEALQATGLMEARAGLHVRAERAAMGGVHVSLRGGTFHEQSLFADAMGEILGPVHNPRYLLTRPVSGLLGRRVDWHAVPRILGAKKEHAQALHAAWRRRVAPGDLVYTRREGGRAALLAARGRALANRLADPGERVDRWQ